VLAAVHLYNQALFKGYEINDIFANELLSPKFDPFNLLAFQMKPEAIFSISGPSS